MTILICEMELPTGEYVVFEWDKTEGYLVKHMNGEQTLQKRFYANTPKGLAGFARMAGRLFTEQCADKGRGQQ